MKRLNKAVSVLMSLITVFSVFAIVPLEVSAAEGIEILTSGVNPDDEYEDERVMIHLR